MAIRSCVVSTNGTIGRVGSGMLVQVADHAGLDLLGHVVAGAADLEDRAVLAVDRLVEPRDIGPFHAAGDPRQLLLARQARALHRLPQLADDRQAGLAVADDEQVDERREQLGVLGARAAGDDQRVVRPAVLGVQRDPAQVEHRQDVRVADLVLEREAQDVEPVQRRERLQAVERQAVLAAARPRSRAAA